MSIACPTRWVGPHSVQTETLESGLESEARAVICLLVQRATQKKPQNFELRSSALQKAKRRRGKPQSIKATEHNG